MTRSSTPVGQVSHWPAPRTRQLGFTLVELLVAMSVLGIILGAVFAALTTSQRTYTAAEAIADRQQEIEAAVNVLSYDIRLAGYKGSSAGDADRTFSGPSVTIERDALGNGSDRLTISYYEDAERLFGAVDSCGSPCSVTYEVDEGEGDVLYLYRAEGSAPERGIVQAVQGFKVLSFILRDGTRRYVDEVTEVPDNLAGLNLEITFQRGGIWRFPVAFNNRPDTVLVN